MNYLGEYRTKRILNKRLRIGHTFVPTSEFTPEFVAKELGYDSVADLERGLATYSWFGSGATLYEDRFLPELIGNLFMKNFEALKNKKREFEVKGGETK